MLSIHVQTSRTNHQAQFNFYEPIANFVYNAVGLYEILKIGEALNLGLLVGKVAGFSPKYFNFSLVNTSSPMLITVYAFICHGRYRDKRIRQRH
jgi:hypothetical protein